MSTTEQVPNNTNWQNEWPSEIGYWWFYGKCFGRAETEKAEWHFVKVIKTQKPNVFVYITDGHFLYKEEGATGRWTKVQFPEL